MDALQIVLSCLRRRIFFKKVGLMLYNRRKTLIKNLRRTFLYFEIMYAINDATIGVKINSLSVAYMRQ